MCTSILYQNKINDFFLARTMDFSFPLNGDPVFIPKDYTFYSNTDNKQFTATYNFVGISKYHGEYLFADGLNENGLAVATLYFDGNAHYTPIEEATSESLAPQDVVAWLLSSCQSVAEVREVAKKMTIAAETSVVIKGVLPLHWIVADKTGACIVIEPLATGIEVFDNPVGVMANSPEFSWHLTNLNQYNTISNTTASPVNYGKFQAIGIGPGSSALGLPGDFTSVSRFVRAVFMNQYAEKVATVPESINVISRMLSNVYIPKGVKVKSNGAVDYTQFVSFMDMSNLSYIINYYENNQYFKLDLEKLMQTEKEPRVFQCSKEVVFQEVK